MAGIPPFKRQDLGRRPAAASVFEDLTGIIDNGLELMELLPEDFNHGIHSRNGILVFFQLMFDSALHTIGLGSVFLRDFFQSLANQLATKKLKFFRIELVESL